MQTIRKTTLSGKTSRSGAAIVVLLLLVLVTAAAFLVGFALGTSRQKSDALASTPPTTADDWTCSMHPEIHRSGPGQCPLCGMDLIPVSQAPQRASPRAVRYACAMMCIPPVDKPGKCPVCGMDMVPVEDGGSGGAEDAPSVTLSAAAQRLAEIEVAPVERRPVDVQIRLLGKVDFDETRVRVITARVAGRIDRLYVDYTGVRVDKGDHLISLYSPELLTAQEELLQAVRGVEESKAIGIDALRDAALQAVEISRSKLLLWGLTAEQLTEIEKRGTSSDHITIFAPIGGVVIAKDAVEGMYVEMGERLFTIADLSQVWVKFEAYESNLSWIRYGQDLQFEAEALPGEVIQGRIAFIDPVVNPRTRTVRVRVNASNTNGRLKPDMFVRGTLRATVGEEGRVLAPQLAGKWISPMHPEIVKDAPGACDICGMPLVSAESLGYVTNVRDRANLPLVLPSTAPLLTGERAVVYVADPVQPATYSAREVELGPRAGNVYLVRSGVNEGEQVVVRGALRVDSAAQIRSLPSMMNVAGKDKAADAIVQAPLSLAARKEFDDVLEAYFRLHAELAHDRFSSAQATAGELAEKVHRSFDAASDPHWAETRKAIEPIARRLIGAADLASARTAFAPLSTLLIDAVRRHGAPGTTTLRLYHCPMAFGNRGADWLQNRSGIENPYFGAEMFTCGALQETFEAQPLGRGEGH